MQSNCHRQADSTREPILRLCNSLSLDKVVHCCHGNTQNVIFLLTSRNQQNFSSALKRVIGLMLILTWPPRPPGRLAFHPLTASPFQCASRLSGHDSVSSEGGKGGDTLLTLKRDPCTAGQMCPAGAENWVSESNFDYSRLSFLCWVGQPQMAEQMED